MSDFSSPWDTAYLNGYLGHPGQGYTSADEYEAHREGQLARTADEAQNPTFVPDHSGTAIIPYQSRTPNSYEADGTAAAWVIAVFFVIGLLVLFSYIGSQSHSTSSATTGSAISSAPAAAGNNDNIISEPSAFQAGAADRRAWESWFASTSGDYQAGAEFWAGQRSLKKPAPCDAQSAAADRNINSWIAGCRAAQERLAATDIRRHSDPEYRRGWNNPRALGMNFLRGGAVDEQMNKRESTSSPARRV
jgi:hypothetical protein